MENRRYFAAEVTDCVQINTHLVGSDAVPLYRCLCGAGAEAQIQDEDCFVVDDAKGRTWFCREITGPPDPHEPSYVDQFLRMGFLAHKIGIKEFGSQFFGNAEDEDDLREKLGAVS